MSSAKRTSERQKNTPATRMGTRMLSEQRPPETASGKKPATSETPSSVEGSKGESAKAVVGRIPLTSEISSILAGSSKSGNLGHMSATEGLATQQSRGSGESNRPGKGSASLERSLSGLEERDSRSLPQEDVEEFREFLHEWKPQAVPKK